MRDNMWLWENNARFVADIFDCEVDWKERFYICPCCGEPVYEEDWDEDELREYYCPICEDEDLE